MKRGQRLTPERIAKMVAGKRAHIKPIAERYWAKVDKRGPDECWPWLGGKTRDGYGQIFEGPGHNKSFTPTRFAHHLALEFAGVEVPPGMVRDHICKNRGCQNPAHIRVVTQYFNTTANSDAPHGVNFRKTVCKYGHALVGPNVRMTEVTDAKAKKRGIRRKRRTRVCVACQKRRIAEARERRHQEAPKC
jgi:hypothetical protein